MEILIKSSEDRFMPMGNVYSASINSALELERTYFSLKNEEGKRSNEVFFKMKISDRWMELEQFIDEYFAEVMPERKFELLGFEDKNGAIRDLKTMTKSDFIIDEPTHGFGHCSVLERYRYR